MGRQRNTKRDNALPDYVYRIKSKNRVIWREHLGNGNFGRTVTLRDQNNKPLPSNASHLLILSAYNRQVTVDSGRTLKWLFKKYFASAQFNALSAATQKNYLIHANTISEAALSTGKVFGDIALSAITPPVIAKYRDSRVEVKIAANRELQFLSAVFSWGIEQGYCKINPCKGVRKFPSQRRTRYVTQEEMQLVQSLAPDYIAVAMELAYLLRARRMEVLGLKKEDISDTGVYVHRGKDSESETTTWTPALEAAIKAAKSLHEGVSSNYLLHNKYGDKIKSSAFDTAWTRLMEKALKTGLTTRFTFHDLKAAGVTDAPHQWAGHKSDRMKAVYIRKAKEVTATR